MLKSLFTSLFLILNYSIGFSQSIDSFQYDFIQLSDSKKLDFALCKLNTILIPLDSSSSVNVNNDFTIVHFGDSHIQGDNFSGEIRQKLQGYFGSTGNGIIFPYSLAKSYGPKGLSASSTGTWSASNILRYDNNIKGLSGFTIQSFDTVAKIKFLFTEKFKVPSSKTLKIWYGSNSDSTDFYLDDKFTTIYDKKFQDGWGVRSLSSVENITGFDLSIRQKNKIPSGFSFFGFELISPNNRGINYYQCGVVGAKFSHLINNSELIISQLNYLMPDLIIFSFGTNEAYGKNIDTNKYFDELNSFISKLNEELPNTAFIITTAPDTRSQGKIPPNQIIINDQLIKIAKSQDVSIFDLNKAMGGWGSLNKWYKNKLVAEDKLHFNAAGYSLQGKLFSMAFLESYNAKSTNRKLDLSNLRNEILLGIKPVLGKITKSPVVVIEPIIEVLIKDEPVKEELVKEESIKKEQVIKEPVKKEPVKKEKKNNDLPKIYIVKKGDSIYRIARKYKLDPNKVLRLNKLKEQAIINVGQKIVLY